MMIVCYASCFFIQVTIITFSKGGLPMSVFVIADTHLSGKVNKSMEKFGARWTGYTEKLEKNWRAIVNPEDTVILPGDISWGLNFEEACEDLIWLNSLPGTKLLGKGNHDFWWATMNKMQKFFAEHELDTLRILYNNAYVVEDFIVCGTRGWFNDEKQQVVVGTVDYAKIVNREVGRLRLSLEQAKQLQDPAMPRETLVFLHFPPVWGDFVCGEFLEVLHKFNVKRCYFGHIHGLYNIPAYFVHEDIKFTMTSADFLNFTPLFINSTN